MHATLRDLPEEHRRIIQRMDLDGRAAAEIARELNRTTGAVYMLRARAHRWLGEILKKKGFI